MSARRGTGRASKAPVACEVGRHSAWLSGNNRAVYQALEGSGIANMYDRRRHCPTVSVKRLDDLLARLDVAGIRVEMVAGVAA